MIATAQRDPESMQDIANRDRGRLNEICEQQRNEIIRLKALEPLANEMRQLIQHRADLGDYLLDQDKFSVDACLGGEDFVPGVFYVDRGDKRFKCELLSTVYQMTEVDSK